jgi:hypothetical protein
LQAKREAMMSALNVSRAPVQQPVRKPLR